MPRRTRSRPNAPRSPPRAGAPRSSRPRTPTGGGAAARSFPSGSRRPMRCTPLYARSASTRPASRRDARSRSVHETARWEYDENLRYFEGEVEPCINGRAVAIGAYFGQDVRGIVDRLLTDQMADGGWNCEQERGSIARIVRFDHQRAGGAARVRARDRRERRRDRRSHPRAGIPPRAPAPASPVGRRDRADALALPRLPEQAGIYDVLRVLDYFRDAGVRAGRADGRGARHRRVEARPPTAVAAGPRLPRRAAGRPRRARRRAEPMDHAACAADHALGRSARSRPASERRSA